MPHRIGAALARAHAINSACMNRRDQSKERLKIEILQYLIDHPKAQDTLEGIAGWWLLGRTMKHRTALVKEALDELISEEYVTKYEGSDSQTHYKITPETKKNHLQASE